MREYQERVSQPGVGVAEGARLGAGAGLAEGVAVNRGGAAAKKKRDKWKQE